MVDDEISLSDKGHSAEVGSSSAKSSGEEEQVKTVGIVEVLNSTNQKASRKDSVERGVSSVSLNARLFEDNEASVGGKLKKDGMVLSTLAGKLLRQPNVNCRVETFGRICDSFDAKREKWVKELGFGGLLYLKKKYLPRNLCYWLLTRVDPVNALFHTTDGQSFKLSPNQVGWVLGIPKGKKEVPKKPNTPKMLQDIDLLYRKYGHSRIGDNRKGTGKEEGIGLMITSSMMSRVEGEWGDHEEHEFKTLFLLLALHLVLCPTQGLTLSKDLVPAVCCVEESKKLDWCGLVFNKLIENVKSFAKKFYAVGYGGGCGGCTIFLAIYYLDRLKKPPIGWCMSPRLKVWSMEDIRLSCMEDRHSERGDFGLLGAVDVAYGEPHPCDIRARDPEPPSTSDEETEGEATVKKEEKESKFRPRRGEILKHNIQMRKRLKLQVALNCLDGPSTSGC